jgi:hypothetical protein
MDNFEPSMQASKILKDPGEPRPLPVLILGSKPDKLRAECVARKAQGPPRFTVQRPTQHPS